MMYAVWAFTYTLLLYPTPTTILAWITPSESVWQPRTGTLRKPWSAGGRTRRSALVSVKGMTELTPPI